MHELKKFTYLVERSEKLSHFVGNPGIKFDVDKD